MRDGLLSDERVQALLERLLLVGAVLVFSSIGYYGIGLTVDPRAGASLRTALDDAIPFTPWMVWFYAWVYTAMLYPAFVVRCRHLFRRVVAAYLVAVAVSLAFFALFPVSAWGFRPDPATLDTSSFHGWGLRLNFTLDPPTNLFPSLHLAAATLAMLSAWRARPAFGLAALPLVLLIAAAICLVKQHYLLDGVAGAALGAACYGLFVHRFRPPADHPPLATSWCGPLAYLAFHASVYLALFAAYLAGVAPWER